ncbi:MAG: hypothetical protein ABIH87_04490 [bacterium]
MEEKSKYHYLLAAVLGVAGLLIILIFVSLRSQTDEETVTGTATVANASPTISSIEMGTSAGDTSLTASGFALSEGATSSARFLSVLFTDNNGCDEIAVDGETVMSYYNSSLIALTGCDSVGERNLDQCYYFDGEDNNGGDANVSCSWSDCTDGGTDTTGIYACQFDIPYFADEGTWIVQATVTDGGTLTGANNLDKDIPLLRALNLSDHELDFGNIALGAISAEQTITITNTGNEGDLDLQIQIPADFNCTASDVNLLSTAFYAGTSSDPGLTGFTALASSAPVGFGTNLEDRDVGNPPPNTSTLFKIQMPSTGVAGTCTGTIELNGSTGQ